MSLGAVLNVTLTGSANRTTTTADDGTYAFDNLGAGGTLTVTPSRAGHVFIPPRQEATVNSDQTVNFTAVPGYTIGGKVLLGASALAGYKLTLTSSAAGFAPRAATTLGDGTYSFGAVSARRAEHEFHRPLSRPVRLRPLALMKAELSAHLLRLSGGGFQPMKNLTNSFAGAGPNVFTPRALMLLFIPVLLTGWAGAQSKSEPPAAKELYDRIASLDAALFEAYNACDIDKVGTLFTEDLEFYHEKGGLVLTRSGSLEIMRKNLCGGGNRVRRELVRASLEVHPINNYGAVQTGEHRFYLTQPGQKEKLDGIGKFVMLWQKKGDEWRISRVVSYGFRPPE